LIKIGSRLQLYPFNILWFSTFFVWRLRSFKLHRWYASGIISSYGGEKTTRSTLVFSQQPNSNFWKPNQNCLAIFFGNQSSVVFDITTSWLFTNFSEASWKDELATLERFFETRVSSRHRGLLEVHRCTWISYIPNAYNAWHLSFLEWNMDSWPSWVISIFSSSIKVNISWTYFNGAASIRSFKSHFTGLGKCHGTRTGLLPLKT